MEKDEQTFVDEEYQKELQSQAKKQDQVDNHRYFPTTPKRPTNPNLLTQQFQNEKEDEIKKNENLNNFIFVEKDNEGEEVLKNKQKKNKKRKTGTKEDPKLQNTILVDRHADSYPTEDGSVKINLSKFILRKLEEEELTDMQKKTKIKLTTDYYICTLHTAVSDNKHPQFVSIGESTGNLSRHSKRFHQPLLDGMAALLLRTQSKHATTQLQGYVQQQKIPSGRIDRFLRRNKKFDLNIESKTLIWFLDAQIPFNQLDNSLFRSLMDELEATIGCNVTIVDTFLDPFYRYVIEEQIKLFNQCSSFTVSFDAFTKNNQKFFSQHYHMIIPSTFEYLILHLDMIPFYGNLFAESIAAVLKTRQDHWTQDKHITSGIIGDADAKGQAAAKLIVGIEDTSKCQNHKLKKVYEVAEENSKNFKQDFQSIVSLVSYVSVNVNVKREIQSFQKINDLLELGLILFNETRWEGRYKTLSRFIELEESLVDFFSKSELLKHWQLNVQDFLESTFFTRCKAYLVFLKEMNSVSLFYQTQKFATGCFVPLMILHLLKFTTPNEYMDPKYLFEFKTALHNAVHEYMFKPICQKENTFLKSSLMHPGIAPFICHHLNSELIRECFEAIINDALTLCNDKEEDDFSFIKLSLEYYQKHFIGTSLTLPDQLPWQSLFEKGEINGYSHMDFWKQVVTVNKFGGKCSHLIQVAAMLLAHPAGESIDESAFSGVGSTMRKDRSRLSPHRIEQISIIRSYIRNFKWNPQKLQEWMEYQKEQII
jgi:hypothetical protein